MGAEGGMELNLKFHNEMSSTPVTVSSAFLWTGERGTGGDGLLPVRRSIDLVCVCYFSFFRVYEKDHYRTKLTKRWVMRKVGSYVGSSSRHATVFVWRCVRENEVEQTGDGTNE